MKDDIIVQRTSGKMLFPIVGFSLSSCKQHGILNLGWKYISHTVEA
jgi:hypothetical protein